jgi:type IX secretion system PorP/SprF family membrane protein
MFALLGLGPTIFTHLSNPSIYKGMMKRFTPILFVLVLLAGATRAQQDPRFTHYLFNQQFINPAYTGLEGSVRFSGLVRSQWAGYSNDGGTAPQTALFNFSAPLLRANSGAGVNAYYETFAATTILNFKGNYAYHLNVGGGKLSFGVSLGAFSQGRDASKYRFLDQGDPNIPGNNNSTQFDVGGGLYYRTQRLFVGLSGQHLTRPKFTLNNASPYLERHWYGIVGYNYEVNPTITLTPSVLFKTANFATSANSLEGQLMATFNNRFYAALGYTQEEAGNLLVGASLFKDNSLRISYGLDLITNGREAKQTASHEIMLSYQLPVALKGPKPAIRTPRYRK